MKRIIKLATGIMLGLILFGQDATAQVQGATIFNSAPTCQGSPVTFTFSSGYSGGISRYSWNFGDGGTYVTNNFSDTLIAHTFLQAGVYQVRLVLFTGTPPSPIDTLYHQVFVHPNPTASFDAVGTCVDSAALFTNLSTVPAGSFLTSFFWSFGDGTSAVTADPSETPMHFYLHPGVYTASLMVETNYGCRDQMANVPVNVYRLPEAKILFPANRICKGTTIRLEVDPNYSNYLWSTPTQDQTYFYDVPTDLSTGPHEFLVNVYEFHPQDFKVCFAKDSIEIIVQELPNDLVISVQNLSSGLEITTNPVIDQGDTIQMHVTSQNFIFNQVQWYPPTELVNSFVANPIAFPSSTTRFLVKVSDNFGCEGNAEIEVKVTVARDFYIGNLVTPNGDGHNDTWIVGGEDSALDQTYQVFIYNRWGEEVFNQRGYDNDWDGVYKDRALPEGAYYYLIKGDSGPSYSGSITLLR